MHDDMNDQPNAGLAETVTETSTSIPLPVLTKEEVSSCLHAMPSAAYDDDGVDLAEIIGWSAICPDVTQSLTKLRDGCPRKYLLRGRFRLRKKTQMPAKALEIGQFLHLIMAGRMLGWTEEAAVSNAFNRCDEITTKLQKAEDEGKLETGTTASMYADMAKWINLARAMSSIFLDKYKLASNTEVFAVEHRLRLDVKGIPATIRGDLDLIIRIKSGQNAGLWIVDNKTCSDTATVRAMKTLFSLQRRTYRLLAQGTWPNEKFRGFIHSVMEKCPLQFGQLDRDFTEAEHTLKSGPRKGEVELRRTYEGMPKYENYLRRVQEWYAERERSVYAPVKMEGGPAMLQVWSGFDEPLMTKELFNQLHACAKDSGAKPTLSRFPRNDDHCTHWKGVCEFLPLCSSAPALWGPEIKQRFERIPDTEK